MQTVGRYLKSVKSCLPSAQADDIIKELSENILAQIEDREAALNRPLAEAEVEAILKQHGHPLLVASRYRQEQRSVSFGPQIIGPALFPFYIRVLKFNLGLTSAILIVIFAGLYAGGQSLGGLPKVFFAQLLIQFAIVTFIFWLADKHFATSPDTWDPQKPYAMRPPGLALSKNPLRISRAKSASQLVAMAISLLWLRAVQHSQFLIFGPAAAFLRLSPSWNQLFLPINVLILLEVANAAVTLLRPDWLHFHWLMRILGGTGNLIIAYFLIARGNPIVISTSQAAPHDVRVAHIVDQAIHYWVWFAVIIVIAQLIRDVRRLLVGHHTRIPAPANPLG